MTTIHIGNNTVVQHCDDDEQPVSIHLYSNQKYLEGDFEVKEVRMAIQIFHTDLKHFDLRKAVLIDPDERRPVYGFVFNSTHKHLAFFKKRGEYMMAAQQLELVEDDGEIVVGAVRNFGSSLYRLRSFQSWMEHISGRSGEGIYTKDCEITEVEGGSISHVPDMTIDELIACLNGEKVLVKPECGLNDPKAKAVTIDGLELTVDEFTKYTIQQAMLERMEDGAMN